MRSPNELNGPHILTEPSCNYLKLSNEQCFSSPSGESPEVKELGHDEASLKSHYKNENVESVSKIGNLKNNPYNSITAGPELTFPTKDTHNGITATQRRERESKASLHVTFNPTILCPLNNLGNTCYFNSGIQILANCPAFVFGLRDASHCYAACQKSFCLMNRFSSTPQHTLFRLLANLLYNMEYATLEDGKAISPFRVIDQLAEVFSSFEGRRQQDCPEMVNAVLITIEDEHRLELEVNELLLSFESAAQAYKNEERLPIDKDSHIVSDKLTDLPSPFLNPDSIKSWTDHCLLNRKKLLSTSSYEVLPGPRSAHFIAMLHFMQKVNEENCELERKAAERKGKVYDPQNSFCPPRLVFNSTTGGFKGYMVSEIRCHNCCNVSRVIESFSSLILEIPSQRQRYEFAKQNPKVRRLVANAKLFQTRKRPDIAWWNPLSHLYYFYRRFYDYIFSCFSNISYALTLEECLDIHFQPVELKGGNKYQCESCGGLHEATKSEFLLSVPEYLFIHMKRFKMNTFSRGKKSDPVIFPVSWTPFKEGTQWEEIQESRSEILDLRPYMHPTVNVNVNPVQPCFHSNDRNQDGDTKALSLSESQQVPSTYTLDGIVNHHGSITSGHYTVFTHKTLNNKDMWLYINDDEIEVVNSGNVADSEEYLLLYRRQPLVEPTEEFVRLRDKARYYLLESRKALQDCDNDTEKTRGSRDHTHHSCHINAEVGDGAEKDNVVYISCMWLRRAAFFHDPGPIINQLCYHSNKYQRNVTNQGGFPTVDSHIPESLLHAYGPPVKWYYAEINEVDYRAFYEAYGGEAAVTRAQYEALEKDQDILINLLQKN